jgi:hypothetical protein
MKTLLILLTALSAVTVSLAQSPAEKGLYRQLTTKGDDSVAALNEILAKPQSVSAVLLYTAAGVAWREKRLEDAGYLFYVARFRVQFDKEMFPPTGTGGDSPLVAFGALQQQLGSVINPAVMAEPKTFAQVLARVKTWTAEAGATYEPGWAFSKRASEEQAAGSLQRAKTQFLAGMEGICTLLQDDAYFAAFRIGQDYNLKRGPERPSKEAFDAARATMERIESEKGIQGIASKTRK